MCYPAFVDLRQLNYHTVPLEQIAPHILRLWKACRTDKEILREIHKHIDTSQYGIGYVFICFTVKHSANVFASLTKLKAIRKQMGLLGTRQQAHTIESICEPMVKLCQVYPNAGVREMISLLFHERGMSVSR